jgi:hypothetical protein
MQLIELWRIVAKQLAFPTLLLVVVKQIHVDRLVLMISVVQTQSTRGPATGLLETSQ